MRCALLVSSTTNLSPDLVSTIRFGPFQLLSNFWALFAPMDTMTKSRTRIFSESIFVRSLCICWARVWAERLLSRQLCAFLLTIYARFQCRRFYYSFRSLESSLYGTSSKALAALKVVKPKCRWIFPLGIVWIRSWFSLIASLGNALSFSGLLHSATVIAYPAFSLLTKELEPLYVLFAQGLNCTVSLETICCCKMMTNVHSRVRLLTRDKVQCEHWLGASHCMHLGHDIRVAIALVAASLYALRMDVTNWTGLISDE